MTGLDTSSSFSCKAPPGVSCQSISGTYSNSVQGNLPFQQQAKNGGSDVAGKSDDDSKPRAAPPQQEKVAKLSPRNMEAMSSGMPIRQPPLVLRVWVAPYEDESGDLHDQSHFYTMVHSGKWLIEANRTKISNQFRPVYPLKRPSEPAENQVSPTTPGQPGQRVNGSNENQSE